MTTIPVCLWAPYYLDVGKHRGWFSILCPNSRLK
jgi:hypothetical protein